MKGKNELSSKVSKMRTYAYWITTGVIILQSIAGAVLDLSRNESFIVLFNELGYPEYLLIILGTWRILAIVALLIPGYGLVKEWAYAGLFFDFTGAAASHFFIGDIAGSIAPIIFTFVLAASWYLRPPSRRM
jgi:hypothetical protein